MRTQIAKTEYLPAEYIPPTFLTRTPSPFCAGWRWGLLSRKIFLFFSRYNSILFFFKLSTFRLAVIFYLCVILVWFPVEFNYLVYITISGFDYNFGFCVFSILYFDSFLLVEFCSHQFRLVSVLQILRFDSSTLYLFNSSACYKQTSMLMWVCFMLVLAILSLSDVFLFVLGVVYRLGIK